MGLCNYNDNCILVHHCLTVYEIADKIVDVFVANNYGDGNISDDPQDNISNFLFLPLPLDSSSPSSVYYFTYGESNTIAHMITAWTTFGSLSVSGLVSGKFGLKHSLRQSLHSFTSVTVRRKKVSRPLFNCLMSSRCLRSSCSFALRFIITVHTREDIVE